MWRTIFLLDIIMKSHKFCKWTFRMSLLYVPLKSPFAYRQIQNPIVKLTQNMGVLRQSIVRLINVIFDMGEVCHKLRPLSLKGPAIFGCSCTGSKYIRFRFAMCKQRNKRQCTLDSVLRSNSRTQLWIDRSLL